MPERGGVSKVARFWNGNAIRWLPRRTRFITFACEIVHSTPFWVKHWYSSVQIAIYVPGMTTKRSNNILIFATLTRHGLLIAYLF